MTNRNSNSTVTIHEVAAFCGLSTATISRAINSPDKLRSETLKKVKEAFRGLGYTYNPFAASLSRGSSNLLGVIVSNIQENTYVLTLGDIQTFASQCHLDVLFSISDFSSRKEADILHKFRQYNTTAVVVIGPGVHCHQHIKKILAGEIPHLILWDTYKDSAINYVGIDADTTVDKAIAHLVTLGHSQIGLGMSLHTHVRRAASRQSAFRRSLKRHGLPFTEDNLVLLDDSQYLPFSALIRGKQIMEVFLKKSHRPTALLYPTGGMAEGGIMALYEHGLSFPDDMSIICLGDDDVAGNFFPSLCALDSHMPAVSGYTHDFITKVSNNEYPIFQYCLQTELILRSSSLPPRGHL